MCEDGVPQEGQEAVGNVVRRVNVISKATSTPSTWNSGSSGIMIIGWVGSLKKFCKSEKMFNFSLYHFFDQQGCVRSVLFVNQQHSPSLTKINYFCSF